MRIGFGKRTSVRFLALVTAAAAFGGTAYAQGAGEAGRLLKEGVDLLHRGRTEEANAKFREVLAADPSDEDAYVLVQQTDYRIFLDMLKSRGDGEQVAKRLLSLARKTEMAKSRDEAAIAGLVSNATSAKELDVRIGAANTLASEHGEYAVPALAPHLGSNDIDTRANAIMALTRIGADAVLPLAASLGTGSDMQQANTAGVLARLGDTRAIPALLRAARGKGPAAGSAAAAAKSLGAKGDNAARGYLRWAKNYFEGDPLVVRNFDRSYTVWSAEDGKLIGKDVPRFLYNFELAEQCAYDALAVEPGNRDAQAMIALVAHAEQAAFDNLSAEAKADETIANAGKSLEGGAALASSVGTGELLGAYQMAMELRNSDAGARVADAVASTWDGREIGGDNALVAGLSNDDKTFRYASAIALLRINPGKAFAKSDTVAALAGQAAAERATRQVLVVDSDSKNAMNVQRALNDAGFHAVAFTSAPAALSAAKATGGFDAIVVRNKLTDISSFQVLDEIGRDFRTSSMKKVVMADGADLGAAKTDYEKRSIAGVAPTSADSVGVVNAVNEALADTTGDAGRERANRVSIAASNAIAAAGGGSWNLGAAQPGLVKAIGPGGDPDVQLAALRALSRVATADSQAALRAILAATDARPENRAAAGTALATALRGQAPSKETFDALLEAMGDTNVAVRTSAGVALGTAKLSDAQQVEVLRKRRVG